MGSYYLANIARRLKVVWVSQNDFCNLDGSPISDESWAKLCESALFN